MDRKRLAWIFMTVGTYTGGMIPSLWGAGLISFSGLFLSAADGIAGIYLAFLIGE